MSNEAKYSTLKALREASRCIVNARKELAEHGDTWLEDVASITGTLLNIEYELLQVRKALKK